MAREEFEAQISFTIVRHERKKKRFPGVRDWRARRASCDVIVYIIYIGEPQTNKQEGPRHWR